MHGKWSELPLFDFVEFPLEESKSLGWKLKWDGDKRAKLLGMAVKLGNHIKDIKRRKAKNARAKFLSLKSDFERKGWGIISNFLEGEIGRGEADRLLRKELKRVYREVFRLGHESSGMSDWVELTSRDMEWLESAYREEVKYLRRFLNDMETGEGTMDYRKRWRMYVDTLEHVFFSGKMVSVPDGFVIDWIMNRSAEHCAGCELLRKKSPYTKNSLPTVPKAGATPCLSNCKCRLRVRRPKTSQEYEIADRKNKRSILLALTKIKGG